ncbi:MAG: hypothetical protein ACE5G0_06645 [Rhodothermales bacterium]
MRKHLRRVPGGGIAWEQRVFTHSAAIDPEKLVDAAVDIAWMRLMPRALERPGLEVKLEGSRIVFRIRTFSLEQVLAQAA